MILKKVRDLCEERGITLHKLEKECDIGNCTISKWENSSPRVDILKKVADYFGVSIDYFLSD